MKNLAQAPFWEVAREDPGTFSEWGAPLKNDVTDGWREQILGANYEEVLWQGIKIIWTTESTNHTTQKILHNREVVLESHRSTRGNLSLCSFHSIRCSKHSTTLPNTGITLLVTTRLLAQTSMMLKQSWAASGLHHSIDSVWAWNILKTGRQTGLH